MKKRFYSILLVTLLVFTMVFSNFPVYAVSPSSWAQAEVAEARSKSLVLPEANDNFQKEITRELFCKLVVNLVEQTTEDPVSITISNPFQDTNNSDIIKAYQLGIVNGMSATEFGPELLITREQVAAMIMRSARKLDELMDYHYTMIQLEGEANFADLELISNWALQNIREANALGIMKGVGNNKIDPKGNTTIEQSILLILRVYNEYLPLKNNNAPAPLPTGTFEFDVTEGTSVNIQLANIAYDPDGDSLRISGIGGNISAGNLISNSTYVTFTAEMVDENTDSVWNVSVSDEVEQTQIELIFHIKDILNEPPIDNPNEPPIGNPITTLHQDEGTGKIYFGLNVATDPDGDTLEVIDFSVSAQNQHNIGTPEIRDFDGAKYFYFTADDVDAATWTYYDLTVTDGINEVIVTIRIQVDNLD